MCEPYGARLQEREAVEGGPIEDFQPAVVMFDQGRAAFYPVAVVDVEDVADLLHFGVVDMPTHDTIEAAAPGFGGEGVFEAVDGFHRFLHLALQPGGKGPVWVAEAAPGEVEPVVQFQRGCIGPVA